MSSGAAAAATLEAPSDALEASSGKSEAVVVCLADVAPQDVSWLWPGRIPRAKLTLILGDPGVGKSFLTLDLAARVSAGHPWPDGPSGSVGDVVLLTAEDGLADTVRPRLDAMGGNPARVHALTAVLLNGHERGFDLTQDLPRLETVIEEHKAVLAIIDPVSAFLGSTDSYRDTEVRGVLAPVAAMAAQTGTAIVGVMHLTKNQERQVIHRGQGSIAFVGAARAVLAVAKDRDDPGKRLFLPVKMNVAKSPHGLAFRLSEVEGPARVEWDANPVEVDAETALTWQGPAEEKSEPLTHAIEFLRNLLAKGSIPSTEGESLAKEAHIAERTLDRAKKVVGVKARHVGGLGSDGHWEWILTVPDSAKSATDSPGETVASSDEDGALSGMETIQKIGPQALLPV